MRRYLWILIVALVFFTEPVSAAQLLVKEGSLAKNMDEIKQLDIQIASLQAAWEKEAARIEVLQSSVQEKQTVYEKAQIEYTGKQAWLKFYRRLKAADALDVLVQMYQNHSATLLWSEGKVQYADSDRSNDAAQAVRLAEGDALEKAAKGISDRISPAEVCSLLDIAPVAISMEKVSADSSGGYGKPVRVKTAEGVLYEVRVRLQVKPAANNPYAAIAQTRRSELKAARLELLRQYPILLDSTLTWVGKIISLKQNGEAIQEKPLASLTGVVANGQLHLSKEILEKDFPEANGAYSQLQLALQLPAGINGDEAKLEIVLRDNEPKGHKRVALSLQGLEGVASYEYQSFTPPIVSLTAGLTSLPNSRLRVGESVIRFDAEKVGIAAIELKYGEIAAYSNGKLTRKIQYDGKIGKLKSISLAIPGSILLDSVKLFENGILVMSEDFNQDGQSNIRLNQEQLTKQ